MFDDIDELDQIFGASCDSLRWAREQVDSADAAIDGFFLDYETVPSKVETDPRTNEKVLKVQLKKPIPDSFCRDVSSAITIAKRSFDQSLHAACEALGKPVKKAFYPWSQTLNELNKNLRKREVSSFLHEVIRRQTPYYGDPANRDSVPDMRAMANLANRGH